MEAKTVGENITIAGVTVGYRDRSLGLPALEGETVVYRRGRRVLEAPGAGLRGLLYAAGLDYLQSPRGRVLKSIARRIASRAGAEIGYSVAYALAFYESIHSRIRVSIVRALEEPVATGYPPADAALSLVRRYGLADAVARIIDAVDDRFQAVPIAGVLAYALAPRGLYMMLTMHFNAYREGDLHVEPPYYGGLPAAAEAGRWLEVEYSIGMDPVMASLLAEADTPAAAPPRGRPAPTRLVDADGLRTRRAGTPLLVYGRVAGVLGLYKRGLLDPLEPYRLTVSGGMALLEYGRGERETVFYKRGIDPVQAVLGPYARCVDAGFRRLVEGRLPCRPGGRSR